MKRRRRGWSPDNHAYQHRSPDPTKIERATATSTAALFILFLFQSTHTHAHAHTHTRTHAHTHTHTHTHTHKYNDNGIQINPAGPCSTHTDVVISDVEIEEDKYANLPRCNQVCCLFPKYTHTHIHLLTHTHTHHAPDMQA